MKRLSPEATSLLSILQQSRDVLPALVQLEKLGEPAIVPHVVLLAFDDRIAVRHAVASVLLASLRAASSSELLQIDYDCRRLSWYGAASRSAWGHLTPSVLDTLDARDPGAQAVLVAASFHRSGHVREAAVARLAGWTANVADGHEIGPLLIRANDWVPSVAVRATNALMDRTAPRFASAWLRVLPLLARLVGETRRDGGALFSNVSTMLRADDQRELLLTALTSVHQPDRRDVMRLIGQAEWAQRDAASVADVALDNPDPIIRSQGMEIAHAHLTGSALDAVSARAFADTHAAVRQRALVERAANATPILELALLDPARSIRELARFTLPKLGRSSSFASFYRDAIASVHSPRALAAAVRGLGETGNRTDIDLLLPLLQHATVAVRVAVVLALKSLEPSGTVPVRFAQLADASARVVRTARESLRSDAITIGASALGAAIRELPTLHGRLHALSLAAELPKWESIALLVGATDSGDPAVDIAADAWIGRWLDRQNRGFAAPRPQQIEALRVAMTSSSDTLASPKQDALQRLIMHWTEST